MIIGTSMHRGCDRLNTYLDLSISRPVHLFLSSETGMLPHVMACTQGSHSKADSRDRKHAMFYSHLYHDGISTELQVCKVWLQTALPGGSGLASCPFMCPHTPPGRLIHFERTRWNVRSSPNVAAQSEPARTTQVDF